MLFFSFIFLLLTLSTGILGFQGSEGPLVTTAQVCFTLFLSALVVTIVGNLVLRKSHLSN